MSELAVGHAVERERPLVDGAVFEGEEAPAVLPILLPLACEGGGEVP